MNPKKTRSLLLAFLLTLPLAVPAQEGTGDEAGNGAAKEESQKEEEEAKTIAELTEDSERVEGLFTLFRDRKTGKTRMLVKADQLGREYIYWVQIANGVLDAGYFRGAYGPSFVFTLNRHFDKVEWIQRNTSFYFDPDNALSRAADANITDAVLAVEKVLAEDAETGDLLIDADTLFSSEALVQVTPSPDPDADPKKSFSIGKLDKDKTRILNLRSYPQNTDVEVGYVFSNPTPTVPGSAAVTNARSVSIRAMHSLIAMPEDDYRPRFADPRIGSFNVEITDLTTFDATPYRDLVRRWHLVKKNPEAEISEPVEPITWWIENTTPVEWRPLIRDAALEWNKAFEKAGFRNALVVKIQPDDAEWDAGDIRYNVLRWTSSPHPPFGGYGPHFANPRTGQIIGADIMLEYSFMNRANLVRNLIQGGAPADTALQPGFAATHCSLGHGLALNGSFARLAADVTGMSDSMRKQMDRDTMHYLILHELGHTLGMNHNMKATNLLTPEQAFDKQAVEKLGLAGSVMDYPAINFAPTEEQQTLFYAIEPGPYDDWFIEYVYSPGLDDPAAEAARLDAIAARSTEPQLAFGNDADDMRSPGKALDPRVNIYDMSSDGIVYAAGQISLLQDTLEAMADWRPAEGRSYEEVWQGVGTLMNLWSRSANVVSRYVGGVYVDRSVVGQPGGLEPFRPVEESRQRQAMAVLDRHLFAPEAFTLPGELLRRAARERRGFGHFAETEDPKIHDAVLTMQKAVLDHLLHPVVLKRISDTELYGNGYALPEVFGDLSDAVFAADLDGSVNGFRQNLQMEYVNRLAAMVKGVASKDYHTPARSLAVYQLMETQNRLERRRGGDTATRAHTRHLLLTIQRALAVDS